MEIDCNVCSFLLYLFKAVQNVPNDRLLEVERAQQFLWELILLKLSRD